MKKRTILLQDWAHAGAMSHAGRPNREGYLGVFKFGHNHDPLCARSFLRGAADRLVRFEVTPLAVSTAVEYAPAVTTA